MRTPTCSCSTKKAGLLVHPDAGEYGDTLIGRVQRYLYEKGEYDPEREQAFAPALVNRIDRNTGGIVIAAKNAEALRILNDKLRNREIHKYYLCIVHGLPEPREATLEGYLEKNEEQNRVYILKKPKRVRGPSPPITGCWRSGTASRCSRSSYSPAAPIRSAPTWPPSGIPCWETANMVPTL